MTRSTFQWGGPLGMILDPRTRVRARPRCAGQAEIQIHDPAAFAAAVAAVGDEAAFLGAVGMSIVRALAGVLAERAAAGSPLGHLLDQFWELVPVVEQQTNAALQSASATVRLGDVQVLLSPEERAQLGGATPR
jgi:hypothetical protein